jgi:hypothetical protein
MMENQLLSPAEEKQLGTSVWPAGSRHFQKRHSNISVASLTHFYIQSKIFVSSEAERHIIGNFQADIYDGLNYF